MEHNKKEGNEKDTIKWNGQELNIMDWNIMEREYN